MNKTHAKAAVRAAAVLTITVALSLAATSCGGDSDADDESDVVRPDAVAPVTAPAAPPRQIISDDPDSRAAVATVKRFYKAMREGDAAGACAQLAATKRRTSSYPGQTCEATYRDIIDQDRETPGYASRWTAKIAYASSIPPSGFVRAAVGGEDPVGIPLTKRQGKWQIGIAETNPAVP